MKARRKARVARWFMVLIRLSYVIELQRMVTPVGESMRTAGWETARPPGHQIMQ